jgi:hypothetical protein
MQSGFSLARMIPRRSSADAAAPSAGTADRAGRVPRPMICVYSRLLRVLRQLTTARIDGSSYPLVSIITLDRNWNSPRWWASMTASLSSSLISP